MKVFLDNCLDIRAKRFFAGHNVLHARDLGWRDFENGRLLAAAAREGFEVMVTVDKRIRHEQNLANLPMPVVELDVLKNRLADIALLAPLFETALERTKSFLFVSIRRDGSMECLASRLRGA